MFWHNFRYALKTLLKSKELVFWTVAFPFILAVLFNLAFARLHNYEVFEAFDVAIVNDESFEKNVVFRTAFESLGDGEEKLFNLHYVDKDEAEKLLEDEKVDGYVYFANDKPRVKIKTNGTNQTVLTTVTGQVEQSAYMINDIATTNIAKSTGQEVDVAKIYMDAVAAVTNSGANIKDDSHVMNMVSIEFYTLIAMACMQGAMLSVELTNRCLPNITNKGKRVAVAPTKKSTLIVSNLLSGYVVLLGSVSLLILFMRFILGVEFGSNIFLIILLAAVGSLTATMMGIFLSIALKTNEGAKNVVVIIVTMVGCMFAGMFGGMKLYFDELLPFVNKISPVGLITDGFYSLYYYDDLARYIVNIVSLLAVAGVFLLLSIRKLRRTRYDSI